MTIEDKRVCKACRHLIEANALEPCELEARPYNDGTCPHRETPPLHVYNAGQILALARDADKKSFATM